MLKLLNSAIQILEVQGAELDVMKGSRQTLEKDCIIISEFWPWGLQVNETAPSEYIEFMKSRGYFFFTLEGKPIKDDYLLRMSLRGRQRIMC